MAKSKQDHVGRVDVPSIGAVLVTRIKSGTTGDEFLLVSVEAEEGFEVMTTSHGTPGLVILKKA